MKNVIITGGTGMIGNLVMQECLQNSEISKVTSITRKPCGIKHPKLTEVICTDFLDYGNIKSNFSNQDFAYFCLGVYTGQVPDSLFKEITFDYAKSFADTLKNESPDVGFSFLSGAGADLTEKSKVSFSRYKGMAENYLIRKEFKKLNIFRPGYIFPVEKRAEPNFSYRLMRFLYPLIRLMGKSFSIKSTVLASAIFNSIFKKDENIILENIDIQKY